MIELGNKKDCCGCGACAQICPVSCICMKEDEEGFFYPEIAKEKCIQCDSCEKVCPVLFSGNEEGKKEASRKMNCFEQPKVIGGWIRDESVRAESSSGGAFTLFARRVLEEGGIVFGAALQEDLIVCHVSAETDEELERLRGSKYSQSTIGDVYLQIRSLLKKGRKVLFCGMPCQTAGLHRFLQNRDISSLVTIDFICHGVPSPGVFRSYLQDLEQEMGEKITHFAFRLKDRGWDPRMQLGTGITTESGKFVRRCPAYKDPFMNGFSDDLYLRPSCYSCSFKTLPKYYSDITIADFWGVNRVDPELFDGKGTSLVFLNTSAGEVLFDNVKEDFFYKEVSFEKAVRRNPSLLHSASRPSDRTAFFSAYRTKPFVKVKKRFLTPLRWGIHKVTGMIWKIIETILRGIFSALLSLVGIHWKEEQWMGFFQFVRFAMVGVSNALVAYTINVCTLLLQRWLVPGFAYDYIVANITAFVLSVLWSFFWNSRKVFVQEERTTKSKLQSLLRTYVAYAFTGLFLNNILSSFWIHIVGVSKFITPLLNIPISMPINFFMMKKWAYKDKTGR